MDFQITALRAEDFDHLFALNDAALAAHQAKRLTVDASPGTPCRVSLEDAAIGETVVLLNHTHQPENSPYQSRHAIFIREGAEQAQPVINEVPDVIRSRLISARFFDHAHMMVEADVVDGNDVGALIAEMFERADIAYAHLHNAKPGCFAAAVRRVG